MKFNLCKSAVVCLFLLGVLAFSPAAHASVELLVGEDGGALTQVEFNPVSGSPLVFSGLTTDFTIVFLGGSSNSPGGPSNSFENSSTVRVTNTGTGTHTLNIVFSDQDFAFPVAGKNVTLTTGIGGSVTQATSQNFVTFQTWVNFTNTLNGQSGLTSGQLTDNLAGNSGSWNVSNVVPGNVTATPFSITSKIDIRLGATGQLNYSSSTVLELGPQGGAPEAGSFVIWSLLAGSVGLVAGRKKLAILGNSRTA